MEENIIKNSHSDGLQKSPDDMLWSFQNKKEKTKQNKNINLKQWQ